MERVRLFHEAAIKMAIKKVSEQEKLEIKEGLRYDIRTCPDAGNSRAICLIYDGPNLWAAVSTMCIPTFRRPNWYKAVKVSADLIGDKWVCGFLARGDVIKDTIMSEYVWNGKWKNNMTKWERSQLEEFLETMNDPIKPTWKGEDI